jgi:PAS domain S-box-containing protein
MPFSSGESMSLSNLTRFYAPRLDAMSELALILDRDGRILHANRAYCRLRGVHGPDLLGASIFRYLDEDEEPAARKLLGDPTCPAVGEIRLRINLPDKTGTRTITWKYAEIPDMEESVVLVWGSLGAGQEHGPEMGFTIGPTGVIQAASPELCAMCGFTQDELVGRDARQFYFSPMSRKRIVSQLNAQTEVENGQVTLRRKDGSPLTLWYSAESIRDKNGQIRAYSGYFQQRVFRFSDKLARDFASIVNALPDMAWVCGRDHRVAAANDKYLEAYGLDRDAVIGHSEYDFLPPAQARILAEAALRVFEEKQELLLPAVPHLSNPDIWHRVIRRPIFDDDRQEVIGLLGICRDVTAKVLRENAFMEELRAAETEIVAVMDDQGRILRRSGQAAEASVFGCLGIRDAYSLDMRTILDPIHPEDLPLVQQAMQRVLGEHREEHLECRLRGQSSTYATVAMRLVFNETVSGEPRMYAVVHDISDQIALRRAGPAIERLKAAAGARTDRELAAFLNVSAAAISNARKNERIPADWFLQAGQRTGRSIDWLVSGLGPAQPRV